MLRSRHFFTLLLFALLLHPAHAALILRCDLESLCYLSTDVVEAQLARHHVAGQDEWNDTFAAVVICPIVGKYKAGDKISSFRLPLHNPSASGQRCILFIEGKEWQRGPLVFSWASPKSSSSLEVVDMLLVESHNQVQRYQQARNPGGLSVEADPKAPTLAAECAAIAAKWTVLEGLKPLLDHSPRREDIPALRALVRQRRFAERSNIVKATALSRLASLHTNAEQSFRIERG